MKEKIGKNKILLRISPYLASTLAGLLFYFLGLRQSEDIKSLFINISATFFAIPLIYLFYRIAHNFSQKRLDKEILDYAKMQIDREILSLTNQLYKIVYPLEERDFSTAGVNKFLSLQKGDIREILSKKDFLGFQIFKSWEMNEENLQDILKNPFILKRLDNDQIISIILLIKNLRYLETIQKIEDLYIETGKKTNSYKIISGKELNERDLKFPDRYLLLKYLSDDKFQVADFGDFSLYDLNNLLKLFFLNKEHLEILSDAIFNLINEINNWIDLTGGEFVIDTKIFRLRHRVEIINSKP